MPSLNYLHMHYFWTVAREGRGRAGTARGCPASRPAPGRARKTKTPTDVCRWASLSNGQAQDQLRVRSLMRAAFPRRARR